MIAEPLQSLVVPIDSLTLDPNNARLHPERNIDAIRGSLERFGQRKPIIVRANGRVVMAGNGLVTAAKALGWTQIAAVILDDDEITATAFALADNRTAELAEWDEEVLPRLLEELIQVGEDPIKIGWDEDEIAELLHIEKPEIDAPARIDEAEELRKKWGVELGQVWSLGAHRIMCGDSTKAEDVAVLMDSNVAVLMNTDPPYGINYAEIRESKEIENDDLDGEQLQSFLEDCVRTAVPHLSSNPAFYLWHPMLTQGTFFAAAAAADILIHRQIIWVKPSLIMGRGDYHWRHELCFYGWIRGKKCPWYQGRDQHTVWEVGRESDGHHPTQKPVELFLRPIRNHTKIGEVIYEPFSGSGSQIIAAEQTSRRCFAMEISPAYVAVAIQRWADATGKTPFKVEVAEIEGAV